jgi:hypothetical protein
MGSALCRVDHARRSNQAQFGSEIIIHFSGLKNLDTPTVMVFPKILVCLECPIGPVRPAKLHENRSTSDKSEQVTLTPLISARLNLRHRVFRPCGVTEFTVPEPELRLLGKGQEFTAA